MEKICEVYDVVINQCKSIVSSVDKYDYQNGNPFRLFVDQSLNTPSPGIGLLRALIVISSGSFSLS